MILSKYLKSRAADLNELLKSSAWFLILIDHIEHIGREKNGRSIAFKASERLRIAQILSEIDMEHVTGIFYHNIVVMSIADAENISGKTIGSARFCEVVNGKAKFAQFRVVESQPIVDAALLEGVEEVAFLDFFERLGVCDHLYEAAFFARLKACVSENF